MSQDKIGLGALKPNKVKEVKHGTTNFARGGKFGRKLGNKVNVPKARAVVTHSS